MKTFKLNPHFIFPSNKFVSRKHQFLFHYQKKSYINQHPEIWPRIAFSLKKSSIYPAATYGRMRWNSDGNPVSNHICSRSLKKIIRKIDHIKERSEEIMIQMTIWYLQFDVFKRCQKYRDGTNDDESHVSCSLPERFV